MAGTPAVAAPKPNRTATDDAVPPHVGVGVAPNPFSPNGDGRRDRTVISVEVDQASDVSVTIRDADARVHREWTRTMGAPGILEIDWGGGTQDGRIPSGRYRIEATAVVEPDMSTTAATPLIVDTKPPRIRHLHVTPDPVFDQRWVGLRFRASDRASQLQAQVQIRDMVRRITVFTKRVPDGRVRIRFRARYARGGRLFPGNYRASVRLTDDAGNVSRLRAVPWRVHRVVRPRVFRRLEAGRRVALTFDDCHYGTAWSRILRVLRRADVQATFFCPGRMVRARPNLARRTVREGHVPASHAWDHANLSGHDPSYTSSRLLRDASAWWQTAHATSAPYMRPPFGSYDRAVLRGAANSGHPRVVLWDVDPHDWQRPGSGAIASRVVSQARGGSIILLHTIKETASALPAIIEGLRRRHLEPVTLPQLFAAAGMR